MIAAHPASVVTIDSVAMTNAKRVMPTPFLEIAVTSRPNVGHAPQAAATSHCENPGPAPGIPRWRSSAEKSDSSGVWSVVM